MALFRSTVRSTSRLATNQKNTEWDTANTNTANRMMTAATAPWDPDIFTSPFWLFNKRPWAG